MKLIKVFQLRTNKCANPQPNNQISGQTTDESSYYLIGNLSKVESLSTSSGKNVSFNELKQQLFLQRSYYISDQPKSPTNKKDVKNILKNGSKSLFDKVLSPTKEKDKEKEKNAENAKPVLMTHRQLIDPFASDEEDEQMQIEREEKLKTDERDSEGNLSPPPNLNPEAASVSLPLKISFFVFHSLIPNRLTNSTTENHKSP